MAAEEGPARVPEKVLALTSIFDDSFVDLVEHLPILRKGALLAQRPMDYDYIEELTDEDRSRIDYEQSVPFFPSPPSSPLLSP